KGANYTGSLHRPQSRRDTWKLAGQKGLGQRAAIRRERVGSIEIHYRGAVVERAGKVDAELLDHVTPYFCDRHLEHDLITPADGNSVHHLAAVAYQPRCKIISLLRLLGVCSAAGKHDALAYAFDVEVGIRDRLFESRAYAIEVTLHRNIEAGNLLAIGIEEENIGLPDGDADHVNAARRADNCIGDLRVGDQHILDV